VIYVTFAQLRHRRINNPVKPALNRGYTLTGNPRIHKSA
jgi:hypothetical protein